MKFWLWNELGRWVGRAGRMFYGFGLWLSGLSGAIDAIADSHTPESKAYAKMIKERKGA